MTALTFGFITLLALLGIFIGTNKNKKVIGVFAIWTIVIGVLSFVGFFQDTTQFPPRFIFVIIPSVAILVYCFKTLKNEELAIKWLIGLHVLRIPVELVLFKLYLQQQIPVIMTFEGWNWDILSGVSAVVIFSLFIQKKLPKTIFIIWNWLALLLLFIVLITAVLSSPSPLQQFAFDQPNIGVLKFPFTWLPAVVVPIVMLSHFLMLRMITTKHDFFAN